MLTVSVGKEKDFHTEANSTNIINLYSSDIKLYIYTCLKKRLAFISETSVEDKHSWSGTVHYTYTALLKANFEVIPLGPVKLGALRLFFALLNQVSLMVFKKRIDYRHSKLYAKAFSRSFTKKLKKTEHDLVLICGGTEYGAYLKTKQPVYYVLDRTIAGAINYHNILQGLWEFSKKQSIATDKRAMLNASKVFFSSDWAAEHAHTKYGLAWSKIKVMPFGANLDKVPEVSALVKKDIRTQQRLLLIGTYWKNKGADIAFNTLLLLLQKGCKASLTVVGCQPPQEMNHPSLKIIPFVDKNSTEGINLLSDLFKNHDFFILPTRFDCTPIVFCEASAFGLPILSSNTGGVAGHVHEGVNGFLLPYEDTGKAYADKIIELMDHPEVYEQLCTNSRLTYEKQLNWKSWAEAFTAEVSV